MPGEIAKAAEEIAEKHIAEFCVKVNNDKGGSWPCICDYHNRDCEIVASIAAIITRCCEAKDRRIAELEARLANVEEASRVMVGIAGNRGKEDMECPFPEK